MRPGLGLLVVVLVAPALGGCLGGDNAVDGSSTEPARVDWETVERRSAVDVTFTVDGAAGSTNIAGYLWLPDHPVDTVLFLVHGGGGLARVTWGPTPVPGYSFAHRVVESGRAAVVIDRPGHGASDNHSGDLDEQAAMLARIVEQLRTGAYERSAGGPASFKHVIFVGHSIGGYLAMVSQGEHGAADAIVPIGWSHRGLREGWLDCDGEIDCLLHPENSGPRIRTWLSQFLTNNEGIPPLSLVMLAGSTGAWRHAVPGDGPSDDVPDRDDLSAAKVDVPVLMLLGLDDGLVEPTTQEEEEAVFASTGDVTVVRYETTGHWIWHHLHRGEVFATVFEWLDDRGW